MDGLAVVMADGVPLPACLDEYTSTSLKFLLPRSVNSTTDTNFGFHMEKCMQIYFNYAFYQVSLYENNNIYFKMSIKNLI